jgi:dipeptidyl-peptidase-4
MHLSKKGKLFLRGNKNKLMKNWRRYLIIAAYFFKLPVYGQTKDITLESIWSDHIFKTKFIEDLQWMNDGLHYTTQEVDIHNGSYILRNNILNEKKDTILSGYAVLKKNNGLPLYITAHYFSSDESKILLQLDLHHIYRRSFTSTYYIFDRATQSLIYISEEGPQSNVSFSPDGTKVAYTRANNLYYFDLKTKKEIPITTTGEKNKLIHGSSDWVYEEEFQLTKAYDWSTDSKKIIYLSFDEHNVKEYTIQLWRGDSYPLTYSFKYPKAGEKNSSVSVSIYDIEKNKNQPISLDTQGEFYIPRVQWTANRYTASITLLNRSQNKLDIIHINTDTQTTKKVYSEISTTFIDVEHSCQLIYLKDKKRYIYTSEKDGFNHAYLYTIDGQQIKQLTQGSWEIDNLLTIDERNERIYYTSTEDSHLERHLYSISFKGENKQKHSFEKGTHLSKLNPTCTYYINQYSSVDQPPAITLYSMATQKPIRILEKNEELNNYLRTYTLCKKEFFTFKTTIDTTLYGFLIKPPHFSASKKYPVLVYVYGGPSSQLVKNEWNKDENYFWFQMLAQKGYIIACIDNRGTDGRGKKFKDLIYANLGKYETEDQLEFVRYLSHLPFVDTARIGIWGWSYGGYVSSLALLLGNDILKIGIAVAPVTHWKWYNTIYTERYLQTPDQNPTGYDNFSPIEHAKKLTKKFLLIHGTADDNVHMQHSLEFQRALIEAGKLFDCFYYPNQNHGIRQQRLHIYTLMTTFIEKNL